MFDFKEDDGMVTSVAMPFVLIGATTKFIAGCDSALLAGAITKVLSGAMVTTFVTMRLM